MKGKTGGKKIKVPYKGRDLLRNPLLNKGTAFTKSEREALDLVGLLPSHVSNIEEQLTRRYLNFSAKHSKIAKYEFLSELQNRNEILFYRLVLEHVTEMLPYVYTPTVGDVSLLYSLQYNQSRGLFISFDMQDRIEEILESYEKKDVQVIVVTDGGRILGLGDVGIGGMVIPIGKAALYTIFGGIDPAKCLPIMLDVGTDNEDLLNDPLYLGMKHRRLHGEKYDQFLDKFAKAVKKVFPQALLQWEDFPREQAYTLLERYRNEICSFNDDIQGTAAVALAGILAAVRKKKSTLLSEKIAIFGAGSAGIGIANLIVDYIEFLGHSRQEAISHIYMLDRRGLIHDSLPDLTPEQSVFARSSKEIEFWRVNKEIVTLSEVVEEAKITVLIGVSTHKGAFEKNIIKQMLENTPMPIVFPLSNPNSKAEADPEDLFKWTKGNIIVATGSPFPPVEYKKIAHHIPQCNNVYIFPAIGLAAAALSIKKITGKLFITAAEALSRTSLSCLFPPISHLREVIRQIAIEVAEAAIEEGLAPPANVEELIDQNMWFPAYPEYD